MSTWKPTGNLMNARKAIKAVIIAQGGKIYNYNLNNLRNVGYDGTDLQNAISYFRYSPQQAKFRAEYNFS
jgi:hypothetical protein